MRRSSFLQGVASVSPILMGVAPFGMVYGVSAVQAGLSPGEAMLMSFAIFAGAAQLAAIRLLSEHAPLAVVVATALVINMRMLMYSASIAPHFKGQPVTIRALIAFLLTDQAYVASITRFSEGPDDVDKRWFYLGAALTMLAGFQSCAALGAVLGTGVPASWSLDFAVPLTFLALLAPVLKDRCTVIAAVVAGAAAVAANGLPMNSGFLLAACAGIAIGTILDGRKK